ncbi:MAG: hypothetical protein ABIT36_02860 [Steroidobacteraceae bacterium]
MVLAEAPGLIGAIRDVCVQQVQSNGVEMGWRPLAIAVNVSSAQFAERAVVRVVERALADFPLPASSLVVEHGTTLQSVNDLRALGVLEMKVVAEAVETQEQRCSNSW